MLVSDARWRLLDHRLAALLAGRAAEPQPFALPREHVAARMREGIPLLHDQPIQLDIQFAANLFIRLLQAGRPADTADGLQTLFDALIAAVDTGALDSERLFNEAFVQHADHLAEIATEAGVDAELLTHLAGMAVLPLLRAYAERLSPMVERLDDGAMATPVWQRGYCPICGAWPTSDELREPGDREHTLRCGACGSGWRAPDHSAEQRGPGGGGFRIELAVPEEEWLDELDQD